MPLSRCLQMAGWMLRGALAIAYCLALAPLWLAGWQTWLDSPTSGPGTGGSVLPGSLALGPNSWFHWPQLPTLDLGRTSLVTV